MAKRIRTFKTNEYLDTFMEPDPKLTQAFRQEGSSFFIMDVQDLIKISKVPVPPARSTSHTLIFLTSGVATMRIGFHPVQIKKNECLVVPAGQVFSYDQYEVNTGFLCTFDTNFLLGKIGSSELLKEFEFLQIWGNPVIKPGKLIAGHLTNTWQRILDEYTQNGLRHATILQSYLLAALCDLGAVYQPLATGKNKAAVDLANRFKELLHKNIRSVHSVNEYANLLNVTPNHLNKSVQAVTRKSASKWIQQTLVVEAKVLLFQTADTVSQIASELGLHDQSYFSRLFKKHEGMTPLDFRKMIEKS